LVNDEFELLYQPQIDLLTGKVASCEALLRWRPKDEDKAVPPNIFIPIAERSELIVHIGNWVLEKACKQAQLWKEQGINIRKDINVSGKELEKNAYFERLRECRERHGLLPKDNA
jgi:FOG: EAL domain